MTVNNDQQLRQAMVSLSLVEQRKISAGFVASVAELNKDPLIEHALKLLKDSVDTDQEFAEMYRRVKSLAIKTYTSCGDDADWPAQAAHFVAMATRLCLTPENLLNNKDNLAWKCAMQARMARNCAMINVQSDSIDNEAQNQYLIVNDFLS